MIELFFCLGDYMGFKNLSSLGVYVLMKCEFLLCEFVLVIFKDCVKWKVKVKYLNCKCLCIGYCF